jgi:gluconokinase
MMHIPPETPFVWGAADGPMSNLGVAAIQPGIAALTIGTSGAIRVMTNQPIVDEKMRTFTYALDETHWVVGGATNSGASVLAWLKEKIFDDRITLDTMTQMAASISAGSGGLIFHPYLGGERAPIWDATARGSFFGLGYEHGQAEMTRAVLEGISYNIHAIAVALEEVVGELKHIQATGGFTNSEIWLQILADIFDMPIHIPDSQEAGCLAAVILSQKALGVMASFDEVTQLVTTRAVYTPLTEHLSTYRELEALYTDLLTHYQTTYGKLSEFKRR